MTLSQRIITLVYAIGADIKQLMRWPMVCDTIDPGETVTIPTRYQLIIAARLTNSGTLINNGRLHIL